MTDMFQRFADKASQTHSNKQATRKVWDARWLAMKRQDPDRAARMRLVGYVLLDGSVALSEAMGATTFGTIYIMAPSRARYAVVEWGDHEFWAIDLQDAQIIDGTPVVYHDNVGIGWRRVFPDQDSATMYAVMAATTVTKGN